ncbi:hypothetical protein EOD42_16735 [Rhodovarius crocodyli]|uniref:Uncharacterized protein n=1 Tax=Rhodovarius crocodyli TaxID=1979269 RepID=A0A437MC54_9PROT|nr:hypothetical protein [Rhodovarius crocodyli]RVT95231.1 hypothetical protein EOD42_16735 [Rhodovarius crocodyli]
MTDGTKARVLAVIPEWQFGPMRSVMESRLREALRECLTVMTRDDVITALSPAVAPSAAKAVELLLAYGRATDRARALLGKKEAEDG